MIVQLIKEKLNKEEIIQQLIEKKEGSQRKDSTKNETNNEELKNETDYSSNINKIDSETNPNVDTFLFFFKSY